MRAPTLLLLSLCACNVDVPDARNCGTRTAYYPDVNGDGVGEPTAVYVGCRAPDGWVDNVGAPPEDTGDTGADTGDTG